MQSKITKVVCIGGGHCNCQVLKLLKKDLPSNVSLTLINESPRSYYSGMLPGAASKLYDEEEIQIQLEPLARWCKADYIQKRVQSIMGSQNKIIFEDNSSIDYDILAINVGSKTLGTDRIQGVSEFALTTRPINHLLGKIKVKEQQLLDEKIVPRVVVCGAGAAGIELSFAFKKRWSDAFNEDIQVTLISANDDIFKHETIKVRDEIKRKLKEKNITLLFNGRVEEVSKDGVQLTDGRFIECNVPIWATGAEPQEVTIKSDLEIQRGFFKVNDYMQSSTHPNIFGGGDCVTMETYAEREDQFPPKAGVYAVRAGPIIAQNILSLIENRPLTKYVPQTGFLALLMTADGKAIGTKFGIPFTGKWVWRMKDYIDVGFMKMFDPLYLFKDYSTKGEDAEPYENGELLAEEQQKTMKLNEHLKLKVAKISAKDAAESLSCSEEETEFFERLYIIDRMGKDEQFMKDVVSNYKLKF